MIKTRRNEQRAQPSRELRRLEDGSLLLILSQIVPPGRTLLRIKWNYLGVKMMATRAVTNSMERRQTRHYGEKREVRRGDGRGDRSGVA
jgi:hypothetical protein